LGLKEFISDRLGFMKSNIAILTIRQVMGAFFRRMVLSYSSLFVLALGGLSSHIGFINSIRPLTGLLVFPIAGYLADRVSRIKMIFLADLLSGLCMFLYVFAPSWEWVAIAAFIQGFMVFSFPPTSAMLADNLEPQIRGTGIAFMSGLSNAVAMLSPYIAALVLVKYGNNTGMRILYALLGLQAIFSSILVYKKLEDPHSVEEKKPLPSLRFILRQSYSNIPELWRSMPTSVKALSMVVLMGFITNGVASPFWVVYVTDEIGLSRIEWGVILFYESLLKVLLTIPAGILTDRLGRTKTLFIATGITLVSLPAIIFATGFKSVLLVRLGAAIAGALFVPSSSALMADYTPKEIRGKVMSAIGRGTLLVGAAGGGTGGPGLGYLFIIPVMLSSLLGGFLYSLNSSYPWIIVALASMIQVVLVSLFIRDPPDEERW